jgi:hypothetical protein
VLGDRDRVGAVPFEEGEALLLELRGADRHALILQVVRKNVQSEILTTVASVVSQKKRLIYGAEPQPSGRADRPRDMNVAAPIRHRSSEAVR